MKRRPVRLLRPPKRNANPAVGDALAKAFEFAATVGIFTFIGFGLDRWLGTTPLFMIVLFVIVLIEQILRLWFSYVAEMKVHEEARRQAGRAGGASGP
jgi:F0F1-type ATP synthase assembly protein I